MIDSQSFNRILKLMKNFFFILELTFDPLYFLFFFILINFQGVDCLICLDEIPVGRTLPQNGPDPRWSILEEFSRISKMPKSVEFIIRKATSGDTIGRVSLSHPNTLEWKQPMTSIQLMSQVMTYE